MFRLWGYTSLDHHTLKDMVYEEESEDTRTHKIFRGLEKICYEFDLANPIWLDRNIKDFQKHSKTRFTQDNFIEEIPFDHLVLQVLEEG